MASKKIEKRLDDIRVQDGSGQASSLNDMTDWLLRVLSGGNLPAYSVDVIERAADSMEASA